MQSIIINYLEWDSVFFNRKIGRINIPMNSLNKNIDKILEIARQERYDLIYAFEETNLLENTNNSLAKNLVDIKITFEKNLNTANRIENTIIPYKNNKIDNNLLNLAYNSGQNSRFLVDLNFGKSEYERLYKTWLEKSVSHVIADEVFVCQKNTQNVGLITIKINNNNKGVIGLLSVDKKYQGQRIGKDLVSTCENYLLSNNITNIEVATQKTNSNAMGFYKSIGFSLKTIFNIYHFWL